MTRTVAHYTLGTLLGRGAASEVYAAVHRSTGQPVAIKLMRAESPRAGDEAVAEAARTRAIVHPNVVRVLDAGHDAASDQCYLVMERVEGENLAARLKRGRLDEGEARRLGAAIAAGMQAAHDGGVVHRDLKPANVMIAGGEPKIVDFGIAKHLGDRSAVQTGRRIGTPAYMAPEQLTGGLIAPCVDVWALGVVLFEAVTGELPFDGYDDGRCPQLFEVAPRVSSRVPAVSAELDALVARCLAREPGQRWTSMAVIERVLRGDADVEDVGEERITQDAGPLLTPVKPKKNRRWLFGVAAGAIVLSGVAVAVALMNDDAPAPEPEPIAEPEPEPEPVAEPEPEPEPEPDVTKTRPAKPKPPRRDRPRPEARGPRPARAEGLD